MDASPDTMSFDDTASVSQVGAWTTPQELDPRDQSDGPSPDEADGTGPHPNVPTQKRRRVTRACDECRRKKIKCDGKQPCTHCTVYSYECTYDQPSNRRRNAAPQYVEALEQRMKRAEALLAVVLPSVDLDDPSLVAGLQNGSVPALPQSRPYPNAMNGAVNPQVEKIARADAVNSQTQPDEGRLESMVRATGQLDLDEHGYWDYHGHSSGLSFMRRMREQFDLMGKGESDSSPFATARPISQVFESPQSAAHDSPALFESLLPGGVDLPPKEKARRLCENALQDASILLRVVHLPTFFQNLERMYSKPHEEYGARENSFLPLLYMVLALGTLFAKDEQDLDHIGYEEAINEGVQYFKAARSILDIAVCRDTNALQAVVFMILFLQSSAKLSTCYAYIGVALRSALRMGLHRSMSDRFNPIEAETRKRTFWVIRKMDIYVGAMLGLPHTMSCDEIDQDYPAEIDDEYLTETEYLPQPEGHIAIQSACNAHTMLVDILSKIVRVVYPIKGKTHVLHGQKIKSYTVSYGDIRDIERELQQWMENLPMGLKPGGEQSPIITRCRQLLRMAYAHAQMMLYRPFIHYVSKSPNCNSLDKRAFACASACVSVSRNIIHITADMKKRGLLVGAYWFTMYTTFFGIMTLIYFALENPESPTSQEVLKEAEEGKEVLDSLAKRSMAADRCTTTLKAVFEQLPERIKRGREIALAAANRKRRQAPSPQPPDMSDPQQAQPRRAATFPFNSSPSEDIKRSSFPANLPRTLDLHNQQFSNFQPGVPSPTTATMFSTPSSTSSAPVHAPTFTGIAPPRHQYTQFSPVHNTYIERINGLNSPIPDLSAMMFPSADPLAYPNQPMTTYENNGFSSNMNKPGNVNGNPVFNFNTGASGGGAGGSQPSSNRNSGIYAVPQNATPHDPHGGNVDVELYNPTPFLFAPSTQFGMQPPQQGQQNANATYRMSGNQHENMSGGLPMNNNMNMDDLFTGEEWAGMFADQGSSIGMGQPMGFGFR